MKNPDALRIFFPECFGGKYKPLKKRNRRHRNIKKVKKCKKHGDFSYEVSDMARNMKMELFIYLLSYTVSVEKLWTQLMKIVCVFFKIIPLCNLPKVDKTFSTRALLTTGAWILSNEEKRMIMKILKKE
jgi:hypothetical protein